MLCLRCKLSGTGNWHGSYCNGCWNDARREIHRAHRIVQQAVRSGKLPRLRGVMCWDCRRELATAYDHRDYAQPLRVTPVCHDCNRKRGPARHPSPGAKLDKTLEQIWPHSKAA